MRTLEFNVKGNTYSINMPNPMQMKQIMINKAAFSTGMYNALVSDGSMGSAYALDIIDIESYLMVLCPKLIEDIKKAGTSISEMDLLDFNELRVAYNTQFVPWVNEWMKLLNEAPKEMPDIVEPPLKQHTSPDNPERISVDSNGDFGNDDVVEEEPPIDLT